MKVEPVVFQINHHKNMCLSNCLLKSLFLFNVYKHTGYIEYNIVMFFHNINKKYIIPTRNARTLYGNNHYIIMVGY